MARQKSTMPFQGRNASASSCTGCNTERVPEKLTARAPAALSARLW